MIGAVGASWQSSSEAEMVATQLLGAANGSTSCAAQEAKSAKLLLSRLGLLQPEALISESVESLRSTMEGGADDKRTGACGREEKPCACGREEKPCDGGDIGGAMRWFMEVAVLK